MDWEFITTQAWQFIKEWYWIPLTIFYTFIIVTILIENRNPPKTIAWILVIICLPIIGIIIYFFFGQEFKKEQYFKRIDQKQKEIIQNKWNQLDSFIEKDLL
ncbi:PLDc N-terminal domain-containing protein, partial [Elizabethkingia anophelis]